MKELTEIIDPVNFFETYWNRSKYHKRLPNIQQADSVSLDFLRREAMARPDYIEAEALRYVDVSVKDGKAVETQVILRTASELKSAFEAGLSLVFNQLQLLLPADHYFCRLMDQLARITCSNDAQVACFYTPAMRQGFVRHIDHNDFFTIQLQGHKCWKTFGTDPFFERGDPGELEETILLGENDFLYLPRNTVHEVSGIQDDSLSVSFILKTDTVLDVMVKMITRKLYRQKHEPGLYNSYNPHQNSDLLSPEQIRQILINL